MVFVRKRCGGNFGRLVLVDSSPKLIFGTLRYSSTLTTNQLCRHEFETSKVKIMVTTRCGDYITIGMSVIPSSGSYVGSMRKRIMNKTRLFSSGLSIRRTSRKDPSILCFASHLLMTACQSSLRQFTCMCFALGDCSVFLTGDHIDGDRSERRRP